VTVGDAGGDGVGGGRPAGRRASRGCRSVDAPYFFLLPFSPSLGVLSRRPLCAGVRRPSAAGRPLVAREGEPQGGGAPGATPDPWAAVNGPHAS
jgi:hypothetical protein